MGKLPSQKQSTKAAEKKAEVAKEIRKQTKVSTMTGRNPNAMAPKSKLPTKAEQDANAPREYVAGYKPGDKIPAKAKALSKNNTKKEYNNINTDNVPKLVGATLGGMVGSAGGADAALEGAYEGIGMADLITSSTGYDKYKTGSYTPQTEKQAREKALTKISTSTTPNSKSVPAPKMTPKTAAVNKRVVTNPSIKIPQPIPTKPKQVLPSQSLQPRATQIPVSQQPRATQTPAPPRPIQQPQTPRAMQQPMMNRMVRSINR